MQRKLAIIIFLLSFFLTIFGLYTFVHTSSIFELKNIQLNKLSRLNSETLLIKSGVAAGKNIFRLDINTIQKAILGEPWVKEVKIKRQLPDTIEINVSEHTPVAILNRTGLFYLDSSGFIIKRVEQQDNLDFPIISGLPRDDSMPLLKKALSILKIVSHSNHTLEDGEFISEISYNSNNGFVVFLSKDRTEIIFGTEFLKEKGGRLKKLLAEFNRINKKPNYIDLNYDDKAIVGYHDN